MTPEVTDMISVASALATKEVADAVQSTKPKLGLVLGGGLPAIPADILKRIQENSYV